MKKKILSLREFVENEVTPSENTSFELDEAILDKLVEIVGSEEDVESAAEAAHKDLAKAFEKNEIELKDGDIPSKLAFSALIVKLVETGKLGPDDADSFLENI